MAVPELIRALFLGRALADLPAAAAAALSESRDGRLADCTLATDDAVEGRFTGLGGCGKAAILMVLRKFFSGLAGVRPVDTDLNAARFVDELDKGDFGSEVCGLEGGRSVGVDRAGEDARGRSEATDRVFRAFDGGRGGRAAVGGFDAGRDGCGRAEVDAIVQGLSDGVTIVSSPPSASMIAI